MRLFTTFAAGALAVAQLTTGLTITVDDEDSVKQAASTIAYDMAKYYKGNESGYVPGLLGDPYYWWECGAMFNTYINYWYYTGDTQYNAMVKQGLQFQTGPDNNYMPANESKNEGNDDQVFWGFAVMSAAEYKFPNPDDGKPGWLALAQGVFNSQANRWDQNCGGGLRWQIYTWNNGYNYKNSPSNGGLFNMAARLYAYTGNETYADWANKAWDWMDSVGLIGNDSQIFDGTQIADNCSALDHTRWTYTAGIMLNGAAVMWNKTNNTDWKTRTQNLFNATAYFFNENKVMHEVCEPSNNCNLDQQSFKAYLARFMAASTKSAPFLYDQTMSYLDASAVAAAKICDGGDTGTTCGLSWTKGTYDGNYGVGEQMAALEAVQSTLIKKAVAPVSSTTGGTSQGDPGAGTGGDSDPAAPQTKITTADRAGAGILTCLLCIGTVTGGYFLIA